MTTRQPSRILSLVKAELNSVTPAWVKTMFFGIPNARPLRFTHGTAQILPTKGGYTAPIGLLASDMQGVKPKTTRVVDLCLPNEGLLCRTLSVPVASRNKIDRIVELDTLQKTPFKAEEVYSTFHVGPKKGSSHEITQWIARRDQIASLLARLEKLGLKIRQVRVDGAEAPALADFTRHIAPRAKLWIATNFFLLLASAGIGFAWYFFPTWNASQAYQNQEAINSTLARKALSLRESIDGSESGATERAALVEKLTRRQTLASILREVTVALPDEVWATDVVVERGRVSIRGSTSGSAAELVLDLTKDLKFLSPRLTGPVSQTGNGRERFELTFDLKGVVR